MKVYIVWRSYIIQNAYQPANGFPELVASSTYNGTFSVMNPCVPAGKSIYRYEGVRRHCYTTRTPTALASVPPAAVVVSAVQGKAPLVEDDVPAVGALVWLRCPNGSCGQLPRAAQVVQGHHPTPRPRR